jgi:DNA-binding transcriptional regulator YdaS (Cro superfamily)
MALDNSLSDSLNSSFMTLKEYLKAAKASELARQINVPQASLSQWIHGVRRVPLERCIAIEKATKGAVRCEDLRPEIDWAVLRRSGADAA